MAWEIRGPPMGSGNLIVGYNELRFSDNVRTGSHNVVMVIRNNFSSYGGVVVGDLKEMSGEFCPVSGGTSNTASGELASVSGGFANTASGLASWVSGFVNTASGGASSVSGGQFNTASGDLASVSGGQQNTASGDFATVSGGVPKEAPRTNKHGAGPLLPPPQGVHQGPRPPNVTHTH